MLNKNIILYQIQENKHCDIVIDHSLYKNVMQMDSISIRSLKKISQKVKNSNKFVERIEQLIIHPIKNAPQNFKKENTLIKYLKIASIGKLKNIINDIEYLQSANIEILGEYGHDNIMTIIFQRFAKDSNNQLIWLYTSCMEYLEKKYGEKISLKYLNFLYRSHIHINVIAEEYMESN